MIRDRVTQSHLNRKTEPSPARQYWFCANSGTGPTQCRPLLAGWVQKPLKTGVTRSTTYFIGLIGSWHYNFHVSEECHYYSTYYAFVITISHLFEECHYVRPKPYVVHLQVY
jgi:hypothetical protein